MAESCLVGRLRRRSCAREVRNVHAARKRVHVPMQMPLRLEQADTAREHDVRPREERSLGSLKAGWSPGKRGELVHAVVHDPRRRQMVAERKRHRCVVPEHPRTQPFGRDQPIEQRAK